MASIDLPANGRPPDGEPRDWQAIADEHEGHVTALIGTLQLQLRDERQALQLMEAVLAGFREREKRIARALAALEGEHRSSGRPAAPKAGGKPPWTVMRR